MSHRSKPKIPDSSLPQDQKNAQLGKSESQLVSALLSSGTSETELTLTILEAITETALIVDSLGAIRYANPQVEAFFGWQREDLIGQVIEILLQPVSRQVHKAHWAQYFQQPVPIPMGKEMNLLGYRKNGSSFPVEISLSPFSLDASTYILCLVKDTSGLVELANDLRNSLKRFESLFKSFPLSIYVWQWQGDEFILVDYNDADKPNINAAIRKFVGRGIRTLYPTDDRMVADIERCFNEKTTFSREYKRYRVPYTRQVKDLKITYVFSEPDLVMVVLDDLTVLHTMVDELKHLSNAVEQTADAVFITNTRGMIEYVNSGFEQMTGFSRAEALGQNPRIIKSGQMPPEYYQQLWNTVLGGEVFRTQTINRRRNGEIFIAEQTITPMKNPEGEITHFVSVLKDMTDRIRSQEMETEHHLAGKVQKQLFPVHTPQIPGYDLAGAVFPTHYTSGDYFDYIPMPGNKLGLVVADVCDHGLGSALIMAKTQAHLRSIMHFETDPRNALKELNHQVQPDLLDSMFITIFLGILDPEHHLLDYGNAGNPPTFILDRDGRLIHELRTDGLPIGLFEEFDLRLHAPIPLPPGSLAVLLTDGIHEVSDVQKNQFGFDRLLDVVQQHRAAPAREIIERVREAVQQFSGLDEFEDDQTIIICKRIA